MGKIRLQFQTPQDLTNFRQSVSSKDIRTDIVNLVLICKCSETDIELALKSFNATVINNVKASA